MDDPIPIRKETAAEPPMTADEYLAVMKQKQVHRVQWWFATVVTVIVLGFLTPLIVWLVRLALGE